MAIWMMLPSLRAIVRRLHRAWATDIRDIQSDALCGFIEALGRLDPEQEPGKRLWWQTFSSARNGCQRAVREQPVDDIESALQRQAEAHPDPLSPAELGRPEASARDYSTIEGERLGALADRLGLAGMIENSQDRADIWSILAGESEDS